MSDVISLEFIGRRLDTVQHDMADMRRRMIALGDRLGGIEARLGALESRFASLEDRFDLMVERYSNQELTLARILLLLESKGEAK